MKVQERNVGNAVRVLVAVSLSAFLAACGGGGSSSSGADAPAPASTPAQQPTTLAPQTSVPAPTYDASSFQATAFAAVNAYRNAMGVGMLKQDPILDVSAQAQTLYLFSNLKSGAITALDHNELATNANYYGDTPLSRAQKAGAPSTEWIAENIAAGLATTPAAAAAECIGKFTATVYHLADLTSTQESIGIGYTPADSAYPIYTCATVFGTSTNVVGTPGTNSYSYAGGQQIPVGTVVHSPYSNEVGVALAMQAENVNPAPDLAAPGRPILVRVNARQANTLTVNQYTLTDNSGAVVPTRILVPSSAQAGSQGAVADANNLLPNGTAVLLPLTALKANTTYTVAFSGARDGVATASTWNFTTGPN